MKVTQVNLKAAKKKNMQRYSRNAAYCEQRRYKKNSFPCKCTSSWKYCK